MSEAITRNIRVHVEPNYVPERSSPQQNQWYFIYTVRLFNEGQETVQLVSRHWIIVDGTGSVREVRGRGVVGKQPVLEPGEMFEYTSNCLFPTSFGAMKGSYQMVTATDEQFDVEIPEIAFTEPYDTVH
jgi:ApaG protein